MNVLLVVAAGAALLALAGRLYARWIGRLFELDDRNRTPSVAREDGRDFVPTRSDVVFAHHFASIAGAGPIVGPIIALAFGWGWAWLWIVLGAIFYGAVHDMSTMCVALRERGCTIAEVARRTLGRPGFLLFIAFLLLVISVVNAVFLRLSADALSSMYPLAALGLPEDQTLLRVHEHDGVRSGRIGGIATTSVIIMTLAAPVLGLLVRRRTLRGVQPFIAAAAVAVAGVLLGFSFPVSLGAATWMIVLAGYVLVACWIPVWMVIQPRDYMNVQLLYGGLLLLLCSTVVGGLGGAMMQLPASSVATGSARLGPVWPIMFITIACGAISGFHALVATGTTIRQIPRESDCRRIGYNAMLLESLLALLVVATIAGTMTPEIYRLNVTSAGGPIQTFAVACGSAFARLGIPVAVGCVLGILIVEGFLITTLDTSVRLARYLFEELWRELGGTGTPALLRSTAFNTVCAVGLMLIFALSQDAAAALWPYFGAGNQLIGAMALTTVTVWLLRRGRPVAFAAVPAAFMVLTAIAALAWLVQREAGRDANPLRAVVVGGGVLLLALAAGFVITAVIRIRQVLRQSTQVAALPGRDG